MALYDSDGQVLAEAEAEVDPKLLQNSLDLGRASLGGGVVFLLLQGLLATRKRE